MGGHALKTVQTVRLKKDDFLKIQQKVIDIFKFHEIIIDFIPYLRDKEDFGDLDVLWSNENNPEINMFEFIKKYFKPTETVVNSDVISFDLDNFQIDIIKVSNIKFAKFYFSYADFGSIIGKTVKKYNMSFGHNGFFSNVETTSFLLTDNVLEFCKFINIDFEIWKNIKTKDDLFQFIISSRFFNKENFKPNMFNYAYRKRIKQRPLYLEFLKFLEIDITILEKENDETNEELSDNSEEKETHKLEKEQKFNEAIKFFNKEKEVEDIKRKMEIKRHNSLKFNGVMLREKGFADKQIGAIIKAFKLKHPNFDEWIYNSTIEEINVSLDDVIKNVILL
jgi:hypothetical protein